MLDNKNEKSTAPRLDAMVSGNMPEIKENAIEAVKAENKESVKTFDPAVHSVGDDGKPQIGKDGEFKKKRGRKKGETQSRIAGVPVDKAPDLTKIGSREAAVTVSGILEVAQIKLISPEFRYNEIERDVNVNAWAKTFDHYGGVNLTPPQELMLSHAQIVLTRALDARNKETQNKLKMFALWFESKINKIKLKKKGAKDGAHANSRENNVGKDDSVAKDVQGVQS